MPDEPKSNAKNETAADFMREQIERAKNNLKCTINRLGHDTLSVANPVPWFKRYPVKCSIVTGALVGGGALLVARAVKHRHDSVQHPVAPPVNVYIKKAKPKSKGWGQIGAALLTILSSRVAEGVRATIADSFSAEFAEQHGKTRIIPNPNLRGVDI